jgi:hypothetical protein
MKIITITDLSKMVVTSINPGIACHRLGKHYCRPMQTRGKCTTKCEDCQTNIQSIFSSIATRGDPIEDPVALLVWAARSAIASLDEGEEHKGATPVTDWLGQPIANANIFELYGRHL